VLDVVRPGTVWQDNIITGPSGFGIVVYTGCSSFHNLSLAMLCWVTISRLHHQNWRTRDLVTGGGVAAAIILLNIVRLCLMVWNIELFHYWHDGLGAEIFAIGASLMILSISLYGTGAARRLE
jgi:exosortase/archaeosortase family protein